MKVYDKQCYKSKISDISITEKYHKAKNKHNGHKCTCRVMIEKSRHYKKEIKRVKNKHLFNLLHQLR